MGPRALLLVAGGVLLALARGAAAMSQYDSLMAIKAAIDPKGDKVPWGDKHGGDVCKWYGVACTKQGQVYSVYVMRSVPSSQPWDIKNAGEPLRGTLPGAWAFAGLPKVDEFACFFCGLQGTLPSDWSNIKTLTAVTLVGWPAEAPGADKWPKVSGSFPESWLTLREMKYVTITHQDLSGGLPASMGNDWPKVEDVMLEGNRLTGPLPWGIGKMPRLNRLTLYNNKFSGPIPSTWGYFRKLQQVDLSNNQISGGIPSSIGNGWQAVQYLHLRGNQLEGKVPWELTQMWGLLELDLAHNKLYGALPGGWNMGRLQYLAASHNGLDGPLPKDWKMPSLKTLDLANNKFRGAIPEEWAWNWPNLQTVALNSNDLDGGVPGSWNKLNLQQLNIAYNSKMSGCFPKGKEWLAQKNSGFIAGTGVKASC